MSFSTHSQNYFIMVSQAYKNKNIITEDNDSWTDFFEEGSQRADN